MAFLLSVAGARREPGLPSLEEDHNVAMLVPELPRTLRRLEVPSE